MQDLQETRGWLEQEVQGEWDENQSLIFDLSLNSEKSDAALRKQPDDAFGLNNVDYVLPLFFLLSVFL